jgi:hypothetical protein
MRFSFALFVAIGAVLPSCTSGEATGGTDDRFTGPSLAASTGARELDVYNLVGDVTVRPVAEGGTGVEAFLHGKDRRRITLQNFARGVGLHYPDDRVVVESLQADRTTTLAPNGSFPTTDGRTITLSRRQPGLDARVHAIVSLPPDRAVVVHLLAGTLSVEGSEKEYPSTDGLLRVRVENRGGELVAAVLQAI